MNEEYSKDPQVIHDVTLKMGILTIILYITLLTHIRIYYAGYGRCNTWRGIKRYEACIPFQAANADFFSLSLLKTFTIVSLIIQILVAHGTADKITSYDASKEFVGLVASSDKTFKSLEGWRHEVCLYACMLH